MTLNRLRHWLIVNIGAREYDAYLFQEVFYHFHQIVSQLRSVHYEPGKKPVIHRVTAKIIKDKFINEYNSASLLSVIFKTTDMVDHFEIYTEDNDSFVSIIGQILRTPQQRLQVQRETSIKWPEFPSFRENPVAFGRWNSKTTTQASTHRKATGLCLPWIGCEMFCANNRLLRGTQNVSNYFVLQGSSLYLVTDQATNNHVHIVRVSLPNVELTIRYHAKIDVDWLGANELLIKIDQMDQSTISYDVFSGFNTVQKQKGGLIMIMIMIMTIGFPITL